MATASRRQNPGLIERLRREPWCFEFFQAVRLLERIERTRGGPGPSAADPVRFRAVPSRSFPGAEVVDLTGFMPADRQTEGAMPPEMHVAFMGLTGPSGVLPEWYLDQLLTRVRQRSFAMRDFLDLFNNRIVWQFYRAWQKYRFELGYEGSRLERRDDDLFSWCLLCLVGLGTDHLPKRQAVADEALVFYAGHFSHSPRCAAALEAILADYLKMPAKVLQYRGRWLPINEEDQTRISGRPRSQGLNAGLGSDAIVGARLWDVESGLRIQIGPLSYASFAGLLPDTPGFERLSSLVRAYVGPALDVDVQLLLASAEVPLCHVTRTGEGGRHLGWNSWLLGRNPHIRSGEVVFRIEDWDRTAAA